MIVGVITRAPVRVHPAVRLPQIAAATAAIGALVILFLVVGGRRGPRQPPPTPGLSSAAPTAWSPALRDVRPGSAPLARTRDVRSDGLTNAGTRTPAACLETLIWATSHGEVDALAETLALSPRSRGLVDALLDRLPPASRAAFRPPERLVALLWTREWMNEGELTACRVVALNDEAGTLTFGLDWIYQSGRIRRSRISFVRGADGWRQHVPSSFVDGLITDNLLAPPIGAPPATR